MLVLQPGTFNPGDSVGFAGGARWAPSLLKRMVEEGDSEGITPFFTTLMLLWRAPTFDGVIEPSEPEATHTTLDELRKHL